jgi:hypothetical protein
VTFSVSGRRAPAAPTAQDDASLPDLRGAPAAITMSWLGGLSRYPRGQVVLALDQAKRDVARRAQQPREHACNHSTRQCEVQFEPVGQVLYLALHGGGHGLVEGQILVDRVDPQYSGVTIGDGVELAHQPVGVQDR